MRIARGGNDPERMSSRSEGGKTKHRGTRIEEAEHRADGLAQRKGGVPGRKSTGWRGDWI